MKTKKELLKHYQSSYLHYDIITDKTYVFIFSKVKVPYKIDIKINNEDYNAILKDIRGSGKFVNLKFNTEDYIDIIYKAYKEQNREEIIQRWRENRLRLKLKSIKKEEVKTQPRRKI